MRVWIDITNSPHVLFFTPLIREIEARGDDVIVTSRDFAQTRSLLRAAGVAFTEIGQHQGRSLIRKAGGLASRSMRLRKFGSAAHADVAFSNNSNDLAVAARLLGLPHLIVHDYEYARLSYRVNAHLVSRILVPEAIPTSAITAYGARPEKVGHFPGLKEHVYIEPGPPRVDVRAELGIAAEEILCVVRPPATMSAYHRFENELMDGIMKRVADSGARIVFLPRAAEQAEHYLGEAGIRDAIVPREAVDGVSLVKSADLVVSAGGTMNREAAVVGTPAYTVFAGEMGAVDRMLIETGRMVHVTSPDQLVIERAPAARAGYWVQNRGLILDELYGLAGRGAHGAAH